MANCYNLRLQMLPATRHGTSDEVGDHDVNLFEGGVRTGGNSGTNGPSDGAGEVNLQSIRSHECATISVILVVLSQSLVSFFKWPSWKNFLAAPILRHPNIIWLVLSPLMAEKFSRKMIDIPMIPSVHPIVFCLNHVKSPFC